MPTIFYKLGFRFYFLSSDCSEPPHIDVSDDGKKICKFWLREKQCELADSSGFLNTDLRKIEREVNLSSTLLKTKFNEFYKGNSPEKKS